MKYFGIALLSILFGTPALSSAATDHVLIMAISDYPNKPLPGVKFDADNALKLAKKLGYDTSNATVYRDRQLTAVGMREALSSLTNKVNPGDRVFVYYSGHGYSQAKNGQCVQSLVSQDVALIDTAELAAMMDRIKTKTSDGLLILDACHAGGNRDIAVSRSADRGAGKGALEGGVTSKVWTPKSGEQCANPVNKLAKSWQENSATVARGMANPENNFTMVAAANEREEALDDAYQGGLATLGLLECADKGVADTDGSKTTSVRELVACAQGYVGKRVPEINQRSGLNYTPHTLEIAGNAEKTLAVRAVASSAGRKDKASQVIASFKSLVANSNGNYAFDLSASATEVSLGSDVQLTLKSGQPAYAYLLYVGSDRKDIKQLFPPEGQLRRIDAGSKTLTLGIEKPVGDNVFLAIVSQTPIDMAAILNGGSAEISQQTLQSIGCTSQKLRNASYKDEGSGCGTRNAAMKGDVLGEGIAGYAAQMVTIRGK